MIQEQCRGYAILQNIAKSPYIPSCEMDISFIWMRVPPWFKISVFNRNEGHVVSTLCVELCEGLNMHALCIYHKVCEASKLEVPTSNSNSHNNIKRIPPFEQLTNSQKGHFKVPKPTCTPWNCIFSFSTRLLDHPSSIPITGALIVIEVGLFSTATRFGVIGKQIASSSCTRTCDADKTRCYMTWKTSSLIWPWTKDWCQVWQLSCAP